MRKVCVSLLLVLSAFALGSCSGVPNGGCIVNCTSNATVSVVLTATPPAPNSQLSIQAFAATITGISLTPSAGGSPVSLTMTASTYTAEFTRVTSDSTLMVSKFTIPSGAYSTVTVFFAAPRVTFCTQSNPGVPGCAAGSLATLTGAAGSAAVSTSINITSNQLNGLAVNANLGNALTANGQTITSVNLAAANTFSVSSLPPASTSTDLSAGQLSHLDDIMGLVTGSTGSTFTIQTSTRGSITATTNSSTIFDCTAQNSSCIQTNQMAVVDGILNADGTITATFFQLLIDSVDLIEGVVVSVPNSVTNQFTLVATDSAFASSNSVLNGQLNIGDQVVVTLAGTVQPFVIVDKGLIQTLPANNFNGSTSISEIQPGMTVSFPVTAYVAQSGSTPGSATTSSFALRFTRVTTTLATASAPDFSTNGSAYPPFFGIATNQQVRTTSGRLSVDGAQTLTAIPVGDAISFSGLFLGLPASPIFAAQSVRGH